MKKNYIASICVTGLWVLTVVLLYIVGKAAFFDLEENGCEMTYMFEYPEYTRIKLKNTISKQHPRYGLYLYGEGLYAQEQRTKSFSPSGIPVLFIPGNAGSYRQVRSLASVALRKAENHRNHFNYFTIDFDEDFSGLYGGVLMGQVNFVHTCLRHISKLYKRKTSDTQSVILIGHSMGGMIARALFTLGNFQSKFVSIIITLGTPHMAPVVPFDCHLNAFYLRVNNFWKNSLSVANLSVISLAGGSRDVLVPSQYCSLPRNVQIDLQYSAVTTAVPGVWLTIDHLALCWCKQLILLINRALFALIDEDANRITKDRIKQVQVLKQYFEILDKPKGEILSESRIVQSRTIYNGTSLWNNLKEISLTGTLLVQVDKKYGHFIALSSSLGDVSVVGCQNVEINRCTGSQSLFFQALPKTSKGKAGFLHHYKLKNTSHIQVSPLKDKAQLAMQFLPRYHINKQFDKFKIFSGAQRFLVSSNLFVNISLPIIRNCFDVYSITVKKVDCESDHDGLFTGRIYLPWSTEDVYARAEDSSEFTIIFRTHTSKPATVSEFAQLHVWKTDKCSLDVTVKYQFAQSLARIFILYAPLIPPWIYSWIMIILFIQLRQISSKGICSSVWSILTLYPLSIFIPFSALLCNELLIKSSIGRISWCRIVSQLRGVDCLVLYDLALPLCFIILTAFVTFLALYIFLEISLSFLACLLSLFPSKHFQTQTSVTVMVLFYSGFGLVLFSLMCVCSSVAIYLLAMATFIHCCTTTVKLKLEVTSKLNLSKLLLVFVLVVSFQTTPAFIVWLKVLPTSWFLPSDPFRTLVLVLTPTLVCCFEMHIRKPPWYAAYIILFMWCVVYRLYSFDKFPFTFGLILLAVDFFVFGKHNKHEKLT